MLVGDWSSNRWVSVFSDVGEQLLGKTSNEIGEMFDTDREAAEKILSDIVFEEKIFKIRSKIETYQVRPALIVFNFFLIYRSFC